MNVLNVQLINLKFSDSSKADYPYLFPNDHDVYVTPPAVKIFEKDEKVINFDISWSEDRIIRNVVQKESIRDLVVSITRNSKMTYVYSSNILLSTGLKRQYSKAISLLSTNKVKKRPTFSELNLDIRKVVDGFDLMGFISPIISDVIIAELPLESIPSTTLIIKKCKIPELQVLLKNTDAKIKKILLKPQDSDVDSISITSRGMVKITSEIEDWLYLHSFTNKFLIEIGLMEMQ